MTSRLIPWLLLSFAAHLALAAWAAARLPQPGAAASTTPREIGVTMTSAALRPDEQQHRVDSVRKNKIAKRDASINQEHENRPSARQFETQAEPLQETSPASFQTAPRFDAAYLNNPAPEYPFAARRAHLHGTVLLRVQVNADGTPGQVRIAQGSGSKILDEAAYRAVTRWRFTPAYQGKTPVAASVEVPIRFSLRY